MREEGVNVFSDSNIPTKRHDAYFSNYSKIQTDNIKKKMNDKVLDGQRPLIHSR